MNSLEIIADTCATLVELQKAIDDFSRHDVVFDSVPLFMHQTNTVSSGGYFAKFENSPHILIAIRRAIYDILQKQRDAVIEQLSEQLRIVK